MRRALLDEVAHNVMLYQGICDVDFTVTDMQLALNCWTPIAPRGKWLNMSCMGFVFATLFQRPLCMLSPGGPCTCLPLIARGNKMQAVSYIGYIIGDHYIPVRRLIFVFTYVIFSAWIIFDSFAWLNVLLSIPVVFCGYIAVVKSKIIQDKYANAINDYTFDLFSVLLIVVFLIDVILQVI